MLLPAVFLFLAVFADVGLCQECKRGWTYFQGLCYGVGQTEVSWGDALAICNVMGGWLAEIHDEQTNEYIVDLARSKSVNILWLGATDIFQEGTWEWLSAPNIFSKYTNWAPNNSITAGNRRERRSLFPGDFDGFSRFPPRFPRPRPEDSTEKTNEDSKDPGNEDCLNLFKPLKYKWNDEKCATKGNFVCAAHPVRPAVQLREIQQETEFTTISSTEYPSQEISTSIPLKETSDEDEAASDPSVVLV